ncbi:MAG: TolC family protein [Planctomycetota bacterium]
MTRSLHALGIPTLFVATLLLAWCVPVSEVGAQDADEGGGDAKASSEGSDNKTADSTEGDSAERAETTEPGGATDDDDPEPEKGGSATADGGDDDAKPEGGDDDDDGVDEDAGPPLLPEKEIVIELSLKEAVQLGLQRNLDIRISRVDYWATEHGVTSEKAAFDPFFTLGANFSKNRRPTASFLDIGQGALVQTVQANPTEFTSLSVGLRGLTPIGTTYSLQLQENEFNRPAASGLLGINPQVSAGATLQITQPLLRGAWLPVNLANLRIARNQRHSTRAQMEQTATNTIYAIEQAYWELAYAVKNYTASANSLRVAQADLKNQQKFLEAGRTAGIEVVRVKSQFALRRVEFNTAELALENARDSLLNLLNHSGSATLKKRWDAGEADSPYDRIFVMPTTPLSSDPFQPDRARALDTAFERRADYHRNDFDLDSQRLRTAVAKNAILPRLDLTGSWEQNGLADDYDESISSLAGGRFYSWSVGIQMEIPLPLRGPRSRYYQARDQLRRIELQRAQIENQIVLDVDQSLRSLQSIHSRLTDLEERVRLQRQLFESELKKRRAGTSVPYLVSIAENDFIDSQARALRAQADFETAKAQYYRATGTLLDRHGIGVVDEDGR